MNWMDPHGATQKPSGLGRAFAAVVFCPIIGALLGGLFGPTSGQSGILGSNVDAAASAVEGGIFGLAAAPFVGWWMWRKSKTKRAR